MGLIDPSAVPAVPDVVQLGLPDPNLVPYPVTSPGFLFQRNWLISIGPLGIGATYNSLRVSFEIERTAISSANKAKFQIFNMANIPGRSAAVKGAEVRFLVGYGVAPPTPLYLGWIDGRSITERKGAELITSFECSENGKEITDSFCNLAFPAGTPIYTIITTLIATMGLFPGPILGILPNVASSGVVYSGSPKKFLDTITASNNVCWYVQNSIVYIAPKGAPTVPAAIPVSIGTGMIGAPVIGGPKGGDGIIKFSHLIVPYLMPGVLVAISSRFLTTLATIKKVTYSGDTHEAKWNAEVECVLPSVT